MSSISLGFPNVGAGPKTAAGNQIYSQSVFGGAWTFPDKSAVPQPFAILCQDCRFQPGGGVGTRYGWGQAIQLTGESPNNTSESLLNWISELGNYLVWFQTATSGGSVRGIRLAKISDNPPVPITVTPPSFNSAPFGVTYATAGPRLYAGFWGQNATGDVVPTTNAVAVSNASGSVSSATASASPTSIALSATENLVTGDLITFAGATGNWTPLNATFTWTTVTNSTGTIPLTSTGFGALTGTVTWVVWRGDSIIPGPASAAASGSGVQIPTTAPTEPAGTGIVTAGLHNLGLRMLHRSGFLGRPGPDSSTSANPTTTTFAPIAFTSSGGKSLQWAFTPTGTWPTDVVQVQVVMSPVSNPNRLFLVPGAVQTVVGGASTAVSIVINIDDATLIASAAQLECTNSLDWYTASATGQAYMQVSSVGMVGNRMFYVSQQTDPNGNAFSVVYASDTYNYQQITKDQHVLQLPSQLKITRVFGVQGSVYLGGPHWTYVTQDNGQVPANWPQPQLVDGRRGMLYPNCIEIETAGRYAWVGDKTGLYYFDGSYATRPISDQQRDIWAGVNFGNTRMCVKDDPLGHRVFVLAVISNAVNLLVWDYTNGLGPDQANFSEQPTNPNNPGSIEMVQNDIHGSSANILKAKELWFSPEVVDPWTGNTATFVREMNPLAGDTNVYRDFNPFNASSPSAIHAICDYVFPAGGSFNALTLSGAKMRITGNKAFQPKVFTFDKTSSILLRPSVADLSSQPDGRQNFFGFMVSQNGVVFRIEQNILDGNYLLSQIDMVYNQYGGLL